MRRVAATITLLAGLSAISVATPAHAETRRALEAEARQHGAPMVWVSDGEFTMGSQRGLARQRLSIGCIFMRSTWTRTR